MFDRFWGLITWCIANLPWLIMALAATLVLMKKKKSLQLSMQVLGAGGYFCLQLIWEITFHVLSWMDAIRTLSMAATIFTFLSVVALLIFMVGYCWEKVGQWHAHHDAPATAAAVPVA